MKKRAFTIMEVAVAFAIFLAAFIPILNLTRGTTLTLARRNVASSDGSGGGANSTQEDFTGNILSDFLDQVERTGYTYLSGSNVLGTNQVAVKNYTLREATNTVNYGCKIGQYYLAEDDVLTKDPYIPANKKCFVQESTSLEGAILKLTARRGVVKNITTLGASDIPELVSNPRSSPPFIYVEVELSGETNNAMITPFQDPCVI